MRFATVSVIAGAALLSLTLAEGALGQQYPLYNERVLEPGEPGPTYPALRNPDTGRSAPSGTPDLRVQGVRPMQGMPTPRSSRIGPAIEPMGSREQASTGERPSAPRTTPPPPRRAPSADRTPTGLGTSRLAPNQGTMGMDSEASPGTAGGSAGSGAAGGPAR